MNGKGNRSFLFLALFGTASIIWILFRWLCYKEHYRPVTDAMDAENSIPDYRYLQLEQKLIKTPIVSKLSFRYRKEYKECGNNIAVIVEPVQIPKGIIYDKGLLRVPIGSTLVVKQSSFRIPGKTNKEDDEKYFHENRFYQSQVDSRFDRRKAEALPQMRAAVEEIFMVWASFCDENEIPYWIAHNTLLGWYWSKRQLPWDMNITVHLPANMLYVLEKYDGQVIYSRYLLEINPHHPIRHHQYQNTIDARLIDKENGHFIDIIGLSADLKWMKNENDFILSTKSEIDYRYNSIFPLVRVEFEGIPTWRPHDYKFILENEYSVEELKSKVHRQYVYREDEGRWTEIETCQELYDAYIKPIVNGDRSLEDYPKVHWINLLSGKRRKHRCAVRIQEQNGALISITANWPIYEDLFIPTFNNRKKQ